MIASDMSYSSESMSHPIDPGAETPREVFEAVMQTLPEAERDPWRERWQAALNVEYRRREYNRKWDESLMTVQRGGQGGG